MMFRTAAVVLAVVSFAAAFDKSMNQNWETVHAHEYIKAYYKLVNEGHEQVKDVVSEVVPEHIKIRLYSSPEDVFEETLKNSFNLLHHPQFNHTLETKIYVHGWLEDEDTKLHKVLPTLYAFRGQKVNWITVDWSEYSLAKDIDFVQKQVVPKIAEYLVPLVEKLMETQNNNKVHFIGFGIGAHISGLASKRIHGRKVARITGLSPAGIVYNTVAEGERLAKGDAEYVDIIHTSMGTAGIAKPIGDVDFFPNGGRQQPAVENRADFTHVEKVIVSHMLAKNYFVESVELGCGGFIGKKCGSWSQFLSQECATHESEIMGEAVSQTVNGTVYLNVNKAMKPFYSLGIYGMYPYQHRQTYSAVPKIHV